MRRFIVRVAVFAGLALLLGPVRTVAADVPLEPFGTFGFAGTEFAVGLDPQNPYGGKPSLRIAAQTASSAVFGASHWDFDATPYRGKRIRCDAAVKTAAVETNASVWMRIDGPTKMAFDNMMPGRGLTGTRDWTPLAVVLDVPNDATKILCGGLLVTLHGAMWLAAPHLDVVPPSVAVTGGATDVAQKPKDEAPPPPHVLDAAHRADALRGLRSAAAPLATVDAAAPDRDLGAFDRAVGNARIVGLGEGTHGTSEFFALKHRLFRELVEKKGFTVFAIEGNQPEARVMEAYVTAGAGDPAAALKAMYFWTWQTQEVVALANWMRAYNAAPGKHATLHFAGFDMQTATVAETAVITFATQHDAAAGNAIAAAYVCLPKGVAAPEAGTLAARQACAASVAKAAPILAKLRPDLETAHDARIVEQFAGMTVAANAGAARDAAMAENVGWLADTKYPHAKIALWAHNYHIADETHGGMRTMGAWLHERRGAAYYRLGFAFDRGSVRAMQRNGLLGVQEVAAALPDSLEGLFRNAGDRYFVDLDTLPGGTLRTWLDGGTLLRSVGALYDASTPKAFYEVEHVRQAFDGLIFVAETHAAQAIVPVK